MSISELSESCVSRKERRVMGLTVVAENNFLEGFSSCIPEVELSESALGLSSDDDSSVN